MAKQWPGGGGAMVPSSRCWLMASALKAPMNRFAAESRASLSPFPGAAKRPILPSDIPHGYRKAGRGASNRDCAQSASIIAGGSA